MPAGVTVSSTMILNYKKNDKIIVVFVKVTRIGNDSSNKSSYPARHFGCFYTGILNGDDKSSVSVNLCHGMVSINSI